VTLKPAYIQEPTPAKRSSRAGDDTSDLASLGLHIGEDGFDGGRDGNAKGFASSTLGARERKDAILQIHAIQGNLRLTEATASSQGNLKADSHPFGHTFHGQGFPGDFNFIVRKNRFNAGDRPPFNSVIQQSDRVHFPEQSALAVNPFKNLLILAGLVSSSLTAGRAWKALAPSQINFTVGWRKNLQGNFFLTNKTSKMTPAVPVIHFCERGTGMILDQILNPIVATIRSLFVYSNSSGLGRCLRPVKGIVDSVAGAFTTPFSSRVFKTNKEPRAAAFLIRIRHSHNGNIYSV